MRLVGLRIVGGIGYLRRMSTRCGYCGAYVDKDKEAHIHDPKTCSACKRELPASQFPRWPSSADGRRHQCRDCIRGERGEQQVKRAEDRERSRQRRNEWFRKNGYTWVIHTPDGRYLTPLEAEHEQDQREQDAQGYDWEE